jgi:predicted RNase H-like HicB family nuclease
MHNEFTVVYEKDDGWFIGYCLEIPGANGQGKTRAEALDSLTEVIALALKCQRDKSLQELPVDAERETIVVCGRPSRLAEPIYEPAQVRNEFTAYTLRDDQWRLAFCLEIPEGNGQGKTRADALENLADSIALLLEVRREDGLRALPKYAKQEIIVIQ